LCDDAAAVGRAGPKLFELRTVVGEYCFDRHKAPGTPWELVDTGYLRGSELDSVTANVVMACNGNPYAEF